MAPVPCRGGAFSAGCDARPAPAASPRISPSLATRPVPLHLRRPVHGRAYGARIHTDRRGLAGDIYAVSFLIDNEDDDPRQPTLTIGYNTETQARLSIQDASDQAEARWNYAFWIQNELTVVGDLTSDPAGATARQEWISDLGLWYDDPTDLADWDSVIGPLAAQIEARFNQTCCQLARTLHTTGVIERSAGRIVPVIVHELEYYEAIAWQTEAANPPGLADEFTSWVRNG